MVVNTVHKAIHPNRSVISMKNLSYLQWESEPTTHNIMTGAELQRYIHVVQSNPNDACISVVIYDLQI